MDDVASSTEWETEWLSLDREQLVEFIRSSELTVKDEWDLWQVRHTPLGTAAARPPHDRMGL